MITFYSLTQKIKYQNTLVLQKLLQSKQRKVLFFIHFLLIMSKKFYLLFCEFNTFKPQLYSFLESAIRDAKKYGNVYNLVKFTNRKKAWICLKERQNEQVLQQKCNELKSEEIQKSKKFITINDAPLAAPTSKLPNRQSVVKEFVSAEDITRFYDSFLKQIPCESNHYFIPYRPVSIIGSLYTSQIFPAQIYKSYLSICNTKYYDNELSKIGVGYYFTRRQEILFQRNIIIKDTSMEMRLYFRGLAYLLCDAWINGIKKLEINCESKQLLKMWEDLVRKGKIGAKEEKVKEQNDGEYTLGRNPVKDSTQLDDYKEESNDWFCSESDQSNGASSESYSEPYSRSQSETCQEFLSSEEISNKDNKKQIPQQMSSPLQVTQTSPSTEDPLKIYQSQDDDFAQQTRKLKKCIEDYKRKNYQEEVKIVTILTNKFESVQLKWLHAADNANAVALARQKLDEQLEKRKHDRFYERIRRDEQRKKYAQQYRKSRRY